MIHALVIFFAVFFAARWGINHRHHHHCENQDTDDKYF